MEAQVQESSVLFQHLITHWKSQLEKGHPLQCLFTGRASGLRGHPTHLCRGPTPAHAAPQAWCPSSPGQWLLLCCFGQQDVESALVPGPKAQQHLHLFIVWKQYSILIKLKIIKEKKANPKRKIVINTYWTTIYHVPGRDYVLLNLHYYFVSSTT